MFMTFVFPADRPIRAESNKRSEGCQTYEDGVTDTLSSLWQASQAIGRERRRAEVHSDRSAEGFQRVASETEVDTCRNNGLGLQALPPGESLLPRSLRS